MSVQLYHHTCEHAARRIVADGGLLRPNVQPQLGGLQLLWLTTSSRPARAALGLTSHTLCCDRTAHTFRLLDPVDVMPWAQLREQLPATLTRPLEAARGARPALWFVTSREQIGVQLR